MNITQFVLAGHSFGGYVTGLYATKYPQHIKKLLLLSAIGLQVKPEGYRFEDVEMGPERKRPNWFTAWLAN